jgi:hypothetical protein
VFLVRLIWSAAGIISFGFLRDFLGASACAEKLDQRPFALLLAFPFDGTHQATNLTVVQRLIREPDIVFFLEAALIVFFQLAHFEHELQVDHGTTAFEAGHLVIFKLAAAYKVAPATFFKWSEPRPEDCRNLINDTSQMCSPAQLRMLHCALLAIDPRRD